MNTLQASPTPKRNTHRKRTHWSSAAFPTLPTDEELSQRIQFVLRQLKSETWLPAALRQQVVSGCTRILESQLDGSLTPASARRLVENLASASYEYEDLTLQSSTLCQIRTLDLELNDHLSRNPCRGEAV